MARERILQGAKLRADLAVAAVVFAAVFVACLIGIFSRPAGFLANIWPANALFLGLLLRWPAAVHPLPLIGGALAYLCADLSTGAPFIRAVTLNGANWASIAGAYAVISQLPREVRRLRHPMALFWVIFAGFIGSLLAAFTALILSPHLFDSPFAQLTVWSVAETVNYISVLPVILSAPSLESLMKGDGRRTGIRRRDLLPVGSLVLSCLLALLIGGPGAVVLPVLPMLWCGLVYPVFPTTLLTLLFGTFALSILATPLLPLPEEDGYSPELLISLRIAIAVVALIPVPLAMLTRSRNDLTERLRHLASHDGLTGIKNRTAFLERAGVDFLTAKRPFAVLLLDFDRFKEINDTFGHPAGNRVLVETVRRLASELRKGDHFARLGGEEFAIFLPDCQPNDAARIAERLRRAAEGTQVLLEDGKKGGVTVSIGLIAVRPPIEETLAEVMAEADRCLYHAKFAGRNRVVAAQIPAPLQEDRVEEPMQSKAS